MKFKISNIFKGDKGVWMVFFLLVCISVLEVFSSTSTLTYKTGNYWAPIIRHVGFLLVGLVLMVFTMHLNYRSFKSFYYIVFPGSILLLIYVLFLGEKTNEASRWISIFGFQFQPSEFAKGAMVLAVATAWSESKGLSDYFRLAKILPSAYKIVLVGMTQSQIMQLPNGVIGLQRTRSQAELVELYSSADVVVSLSKGESFGLTPVEGMACGTPAVVYDNAALPELISEDTGAVVPAGDVDSVAKAIERICTMSKSERDRVKDCCLQRARGNSYAK